MQLFDILFKGYGVPDAPTTYTHVSGLAIPGEHYVPPAPPKPRVIGNGLGKQPLNELGLSSVQSKIYDMVVKANRPVSAMELKGQWTQNYISLTLTKLWKMGKLTRKKVTIGRARHYAYEVKA